MLQTGRIVQDFTQGGVGGILNNIEGIARALGGGAGLAGVLTVVGTAAFIARPHLMRFYESFGNRSNLADFRTDLEKIGDVISAIGKKEIKLPVDTAALEVAQKALDKLHKSKAAFDSLMDAKPKDVEKSSHSFREILTESARRKDCSAPGGRRGRISSIGLTARTSDGSRPRPRSRASGRT